MNEQKVMSPEEADNHAHWEKTAGGEYLCSKCGRFAALNRNLKHVFKDPYCRHCGRKMDEEG